ncbi:alpha-ketoglutarate-dependent dioxygenase FTO-like [Saccoglossus kowalevskii]|uniref:Alpha-ketoglutarate-dependent dioxygenase FTO n=2 Tax=Saccoglossus kowalevskii TaxID=10224 RepID=A0A0U2U2H3_SACKO|nr:alpha-ketoglutarate-dependent dioxygenase fto-like [Saccoglossus kowalevskii]
MNPRMKRKIPRIPLVTSEGEVAGQLALPIRKQKLLSAVKETQVKFLSPVDTDYKALVAENYDNFVVQPGTELSSELHTRLQQGFETLLTNGYLYQHRIRFRNKTVMTPVSRTLIGEPGMTYRYLNLRLFALPWTFDDKKKLSDVEKACNAFYELNTYFKDHVNKLITEKFASSTGRKIDETDDSLKTIIQRNTEFKATILNYMDPSEIRLKQEPYYNMGDIAVSWHKDESLVDGSTVAVYNHVPMEARQDCSKWKVGLKVAWDITTPAVCTPLNNKDCYYMLDTMNDTHQHCVIAGTLPRYSSTHRVVESSDSTLCYIQQRCQTALDNIGYKDQIPYLKSLETDVLQLIEEIHSEIEFEWLRQFWMQGTQHSQERQYWLKPMEQLQEDWKTMELMTKLMIDIVVKKKDQSHMIAKILLPSLVERNELRNEWMNRYSEKEFYHIPEEHRPIYEPCWTDANSEMPLPFDLSQHIDIIQECMDTNDSQ